MKIFLQKNIILIIGIGISLIAEFFSISGLSKLFSGAMISVIIMASSLGIGKLLIASLLKEYWLRLDRYLRIYLTFCLVVLCFITSIGIYGFLSDAYSQTKQKDQYVQTKINLIKKKKELFESNSFEFKNQLNLVNNSISELRKSLSTNNQTQQLIKGHIITNITSSNKSGIQSQIDKALIEKETIDSKLSIVNDSITNLELSIIEHEQSNTAGSELGSLKYISIITGLDMDSVVNILLIILILVFDPLAISLLWTHYSIKDKSVEEKPSAPEIVADPAPVIEEVKPVETKPVKKVRNVKKRLGRPPGKKQVNKMIDEIINNPNPPETIKVPNDLTKKTDEQIQRSVDKKKV